jgi:hypothetical protein
LTVNKLTINERIIIKFIRLSTAIRIDGYLCGNPIYIKLDIGDIKYYFNPGQIEFIKTNYEIINGENYHLIVPKVSFSFYILDKDLDTIKRNIDFIDE